MRDPATTYSDGEHPRRTAHAARHQLPILADDDDLEMQLEQHPDPRERNRAGIALLFGRAAATRSP